MKKEILIIIILCCFGGLCHGQKKKGDSLLCVLKTLKEDTGKVNIFNALAREFWSDNPDTAVYFAREALALATKLKYKIGIADAYTKIGVGLDYLGKYKEALKNFNDASQVYDELLTSPTIISKARILQGKAHVFNDIGIVYDDLGNNPEALKNYFNSLKIFEEIGDKHGIASANSDIGVIYKHQGNYPEALKSYFASLKIFEETGDKLALARTYYNIGNIYQALSNYPEALKNNLTALKISEEIGNKQEIANSYNNLGIIYINQGNYADALKNYFAALAIYEKLGNKMLKAGTLNNIGMVYESQANYAEALKNYFEALELNEELGNKRWKAYNLVNIGNIYSGQGNYTEGLKNQLASLKIEEEIGDIDNMACSFNNIGNDYLKLRKNNEASRYLYKGLSLAKEIGSLESIRNSYRSLAILDSAQGNFKQAFEDQKMYMAYRDSIMNNENTKKTVRIQMQYEFDKKESVVKAEQEKKDALALKELQRQKLLRNFFIGMILLLLVLSYLIYRGYRARQLLRLNDIRNRIAGDLHDDIGSTLNSISIYSEVARKNDEHHDEALEMIGDAARKVTDAMSDIVWTVNSENDSFEDIIFRMNSLAYNLFSAKKIEFIFDADETLDAKKLSLEERRNFYLIFKEAVNNLVKYSNATHASITLTEEDKRIRLHIRDDGVGFDTSGEIIGNGLKNMKRRAEELGAIFVIESKIGGGTQIELTLKG